MNPGATIAVLTEAQIAEFEEFVYLEFKGKVSRPILQKFSTYKRRVLASPKETPLEPSKPETPEIPEIQTP